ncbi:hypothetical protein H0H81_011482 [Sphagnurus paluster]|uniref:C2 domain-containing protein n=1 Tax=Sphagnurus paluster TaxID=117069 RepID=A0A9P7FSC0_9AGAR|nr:hypothetical protein H0H81_011482 [Sphagnurus paluster]
MQENTKWLGLKPKSYVSITIGSSLTQKTLKAKGNDPEWRQQLILYVLRVCEMSKMTWTLSSDASGSSSNCVIEIVRVSKLFGKKVIARSDDIVLPSAGADTAQTYTFKSKIQLFLTWKVTVHDSEQTVTAPLATSTNVSDTPEVPDPVPVEPEKGTIAHLNQTITAAQPAVGSDGKPQIPGLNTQLTKVMGYVKKLVDIGGHIAEVHPYAKVAFMILTAGQTILQNQIDCCIKVQQLWDTIADALNFMNDVEPLTKISGHEKHAQAIILQLYNSVSYLQEYQAKGFFKNMLKGILTKEADETLDQLISSFADLKMKFMNGIAIDKWKISKAIQETLDETLYISE